MENIYYVKIKRYEKSHHGFGRIIGVTLIIVPGTALHLARSFILCHSNPVRSVHLPDNTKGPVILGSALPHWHILSIQVRLSNAVGLIR